MTIVDTASPAFADAAKVNGNFTALEAEIAALRANGHYADATFPTDFKVQARTGYRADIMAANGEGTTGVQSLSINGLPIQSTIDNFLATSTPDVVGISGWALRGASGTNPLVVGNFGAWFENNAHIVWATEIDVNNEGATQMEGSDNGGVGVAVNTGSTYSPDTGISIRRFAGAGSGPGFLRGITIAGARNVGLRVEAMSPSAIPSLTPAAPGTIKAVQVLVGGDTNTRFEINQDGEMSWGSGSAAHDVAVSRGAGSLNVWGNLNVAGGKVLYIAGIQVLKGRETGWTPMTGTANKAATFDTSTVTLQQLAQRVKALQDALAAHGIIGA